MDKQNAVQTQIIDLSDRVQTDGSAEDNKANKSRLGYIGRIPSHQRKSDSWFTPSEYIESARLALGGIVLDPFSDRDANKIVKADHYFGEEEDGLTQDWNVAPFVSVFMNPPYSAKLVASCMYKFLHEYRAGHIQSGIILTNNATETRWFQATLGVCSGLCLTNYRIGFWNADGKVVSNNTRGQVFFYFGKDYRQFKTPFKVHGTCIKIR